MKCLDDVLTKYFCFLLTTEEMFDRILSLIKTEMSRRTIDHDNLTSLLDQSFDQRRNWVKFLNPETRVDEILETYSCFSHHQHVSNLSVNT